MIDDDTRMLRDSAMRFFADADTAKALRSARNARDLQALGRGAWDGLVELGLAGILIPEEFGGAGLDYGASIHVAEAMGRALAAGPFTATAVMAATAVGESGNEAFKRTMLPAIAAGTIVVLAVDETPRHRPPETATVARRSAGGYRISGRKIAVSHGNVAAKLIVTAKLEDGLGLFAADAGAPGVAMTTHMGVDSHPAVAIEFRDVEIGEADLLSGPDGSTTVLERALDAGRLHLAAEMVGLAGEAFDRTVEYLKTRVQFGRKIGEFQALQHRAAILFGELEMARSVVLKAATEGGDGKRFAEYVSLAKAKAGEVAERVITEAVQLHGGIGVTDEFDLGLYLKRARAAASQLGDWAFHVERRAQILGL
jgi:alkylation response protein AidB-like acyl-CoA dehydrogenase